MEQLEIAGEPCFSIRGTAIAAGNVTTDQHHNLFPQVVFDNGIRLSKVLCCGILAARLESGDEHEFIFQGDRSAARLVAVRLPSGVVLGLDETSYEAASAKLKVAGWSQIPFGLITLIAVVGVIFLLRGWALLSNASMLDRAVRVSRELEGRAVPITKTEGSSLVTA